jgi:hypothetical protein
LLAKEAAPAVGAGELTEEELQEAKQDAERQNKTH